MHSSQTYNKPAMMLAMLWLAARIFAISESDSTTVDHDDSLNNHVNSTSVPSQENNETPAPPLWMEFYSEGANEPSENNNPNGYVEVKIGKRIVSRFPVDLYTKVRAEGDRDHYFWHNREDAGVGGRFHILTEKASLFFMTEGTVGRFNPDPGAEKALENTQAGFTQLQSKLLEDEQNGLTQLQSQLSDNEYQLEQDAFRQSLNIGNGDSLQKHIDALSGSIDKLQSYIDSIKQVTDSLQQQLADSIQQITDSLRAIPTGLVTDFKAGFVFYKGWGNNPDGRIFPFRPWGDIYADLIFLSSLRQIQVRSSDNAYHNAQCNYTNLIASFDPKIGVVLIEGLLGSVVAYAEGNCLVDLRGDWYNNLGWVAGGLRYKPFSAFDLSILAEYDAGSYWGRQYKDDVNPNKQTFMNFRLGINIWYGVGN